DRTPLRRQPAPRARPRALLRAGGLGDPAALRRPRRPGDPRLVRRRGDPPRHPPAAGLLGARPPRGAHPEAPRRCGQLRAGPRRALAAAPARLLPRHPRDREGRVGLLRPRGRRLRRLPRALAARLCRAVRDLGRPLPGARSAVRGIDEL
ncbi:MAG: hypothetical protein AVDCRST_MAG30-2199, partial [uncultured Solirubrobacteraceae bacterium]